MTEAEQLDRLKKNINNLGWSMQDAPFKGVSPEACRGVNFAISKILEGTGITVESLIAEQDERGWFKL